LESWWTFESSENYYKGQNPLDWRVFYIIRKFLKHKCLKWLTWFIWTLLKKVMAKRRARSQICQFGFRVYDLRSNWQIWLPTIKSQKSPLFPCLQVACNISLKISWWGLQLCFKPHFDRRSAHKVMRPQSCESPNFGNFPKLGLSQLWEFPKVGTLTTLGISGLPLGSLKTKWHLDAGPLSRHIFYHR
jgi:hypothetical protein